MGKPSPTPSTFSQVRGRDIAALHDARPACLIGARSDEGEVCFATVIWVTPLSHDPAMVAFALREKSHTMGIIRQTGSFSISVPPADQEGIRLVEFCGKNTGRATSKGDAVAHELINIGEINAEGSDSYACASHSPRLVPIPLHTYSWAACSVESIQQTGDHLLVIGKVVQAATRAPRDARGQLVPSDSLLCVQHGHYAKATALS